MKKVIATMVTVVMMAAVLTGCGKGKDNSSTEAGYSIGISQFAEHGSLDNCREGFLEGLKEAGYEIAYMGSYDGIEKKLIGDFEIPYTGISTGKFRRYLDIKNFSDPFRVIKGFSEAKKYLKELK